MLKKELDRLVKLFFRRERVSRPAVGENTFPTIRIMSLYNKQSHKQPMPLYHIL